MADGTITLLFIQLNEIESIHSKIRSILFYASMLYTSVLSLEFGTKKHSEEFCCRGLLCVISWHLLNNHMLFTFECPFPLRQKLMILGKLKFFDELINVILDVIICL